MVDDVFDRLVEQAACRGLLDSTYRIDSTHVTAIQYNDEATWNYDSTAEEHYYGFGCVIVSAGPKIPIAAEFTQRKQIDAETAMRVTKDALAVDTDLDARRQRLRRAGVARLLSQESCRLRRTTHAIRTIHLTSNTGSKTALTNTPKTSVSNSQYSPGRTIIGRKWNEQTKPARTAASGTSAPEAAYMHEHRCSLHCVSA